MLDFKKKLEELREKQLQRIDLDKSLKSYSNLFTTTTVMARPYTAGEKIDDTRDKYLLDTDGELMVIVTEINRRLITKALFDKIYFETPIPKRIGGLKGGELSVFAANHNTGRSMLSHEYLGKSTVSTYLEAREAASNIIKGV